MNIDGLPRGVLETEGSDNSKLFAIEVNGSTIQIGILNFSDRLFIILSKSGHLGSFIVVQRNTFGVEEEREDLYDIRTLFGNERLDLHVTARILADSLSVTKPIVFAISLKDVTFPTVEIIKQALLENKIW